MHSTYDSVEPTCYDQAVDNSCGHTTDFYLGKSDLPKENFPR